MSVKASIWARDIRQAYPELSAAETFTLILLADKYNDEKLRAWPSYATLQQISGMSRNTVIRAVKALKQKGLIEVEVWLDNQGGGQKSNRYYMPKVDPRSRARNVPVFTDASDDEQVGKDADGYDIDAA